MTPMMMEEAVFVDAPKPRVSFLSLVELGCPRVGDTLRLKGKGTLAQVQEDGTLVARRDAGAPALRGSIHRLGALLLGLPSCNGWMHWYYTDHMTGESQLIDALRPRGYALDPAEVRG